MTVAAGDEQLLQQARTDLASLSRVSHRLAMVDTTDKLQSVLDKLLPRLLMRIGANHKAKLQHPPGPTKDALEKIHVKLVEMLSHSMKRVRHDEACILPCRAILNLLLLEGDKVLPKASPSVDPFTMNLSLAFLTMGIHRCSVEEIERMLPGLIVLHGHHSSSIESLRTATKTSQWHQISHLLLRCIERIVQEEEKRSKSSGIPKAYKANKDGESSYVSNNKRLKPSETRSATELPTGKEEAESLEVVRRICSEDETSAAALYSLFLDVLLYQTVAGNVPPSGLSQAGRDRLRLGNSRTARDWGAEMAPRAPLVKFKSHIIDFVSPNRRWAPFGGIKKPDEGSEDPNEESLDRKVSSVGMARAIALLVNASGDPSLEVSQRAVTYLKQHTDKSRGGEGGTQAIDSPLSLVKELLVLCVGDSNAEMALKSSYLDSVGDLGVLGTRMSSDQSEDRQLVLSLKRRMVSDGVFSALAEFVAKTLDESPRLLSYSHDDDNDNKEKKGTTFDSIISIGTLAVLASTKMLTNLKTASGLTVLRAKNYIAASKLLNASAIRFTSLLDEDDKEHSDLSFAVRDLLSKILSVACTTLSVVETATNDSLGTSSEGNIAVRDPIYGCVSVLCRSKWAYKSSPLFSLGDASDGENVSVATAKLLFTCAAREVDALKPRAVAVLDALLAAYCRSYVDMQPSEPVHSGQQAGIETQMRPVNPWAKMTDGLSKNLQNDDTESKRQLALLILPLIWNASQPHQSKQSRVAAARWSGDLLKLLDLSNACHLLCFIAGDSDVTAASIARNNLGLETRGRQIIPTLDEESEMALPDFTDLTSLLFPTQANTGSRPSYWEFSSKGKACALEFSLRCLLNDLYGGDEEAVALFVSAVCRSLSEVSALGREHVELLDESTSALRVCASSSQLARSLLLSGDVALNLVSIEELCFSAHSSKARRFLAASCGSLLEDHSLWQKSSRSNWNESIEQIIRKCSERLLSPRGNAISSSHGAAFLGGAAIRALRLHPDSLGAGSEKCWTMTNKILQALGKGLADPADIFMYASADGLAAALSYESNDAPILDKRLYEGLADALVNIEVALRRYGNGEYTDPTKACKLAHAAQVCLAASTSAAGMVSQTDAIYIGPARNKCVATLTELLGSQAFRKDEEVALRVGEALASYADAYSPQNVVWSSKSNAEWPKILDMEFAMKLPPHEQVIYILLRKAAQTNNPHKRTACAPALLGVVARAARKVNQDPSNMDRVLVKALRSRLNEVQNTFIALLADPKSKHLSRESCCLGLCCCRGLASESGDDMNDKLLRAFGQTTNYGGSAMMETRAQADARRRANRVESLGRSSEGDLADIPGPEVDVGGASGLSEAALGAYREMAGAAVSLGRPDVLYSLLMLSISHPVWFATDAKFAYSAPSLLGENLIGASNTLEMRNALRPHISKLLPRLLRACHDPNKETRDQMARLWTGLAGTGAEARLSISQHLIPTIDVLIEDTASKLWRGRVGACGALSQILVGRSWDELGGGSPVFDDEEAILQSTSVGAAVRLLRLWRVSMRSLDDVRGSVRESGEVLARTVRGLTIRLCDPTATDENGKLKTGDQRKVQKDARYAAATALRWIIKRGLNQPCAEATGICISTLVGIIEVVNSNILGPLLPDLIRSLLLAMSGLEPAALNFLQIREESGSDSFERLERIRLQLAQSGPLATAVTKCLSMLPTVSLETQKAVVPELDQSLRLSAGFASRAATADAVSLLCSTCADAFKFPGSGSTNPAVRLLRALYYASERERGQAAKDRMAHALGSLASLCPGSSVRSLAIRACERYNQATGSFDDPAARRAASMALRSIAVRASNQFSDGGSSDIWCRRILPVAFLGKNDTDEKVASLWQEVWLEGGSAANLVGAVDNFGGTLEEKLLPSLVRECKRGLEEVSWSRRTAGAVAITQLANMNILSPAPRSTSRKTSSASFAEAERARRRAKASNIALSSCVDRIAGVRIWNGKSKVVQAATKIASNWASALSDNNVSKHELLGIDDGTSDCEWEPLLVSSNGSDDLFAGDRWFGISCIETGNESTVDDHEPETMVVDEDGGHEEKINFAVGDEELEKDYSEAQNEPTATTYKTVTFLGLIKLLMGQAFSGLSSDNETLPYRAIALQCVRDFLKSPLRSTTGNAVKKEAYQILSPVLVPVFDSDGKANQKKESPLIVARAIECLSASLWDGVGSGSEDSGGISGADVTNLLKVFLSNSRMGQPAWTVREAACFGCAAFATCSHPSVIQDYVVVSILVDCVAAALNDRKFWKVRFAGMSIISSLVERVGSSPGTSISSGPTPSVTEARAEQQLILEALLPHKERILALTRKVLSDPESKLTATGTRILESVSWWP